MLQTCPRRIAVANPDGERFGAIDSRTGFQLHLADIAHMRVIQRLLTDIGLTATRATALAFIRANSGCGQAELGRALEINRASTMEVVNALVQAQAVERRPGRDKRSNALVLTPVGEALFQQFDAITIEVDAIITAALSDEDVRTLERLLDAVRQASERHLER